MISLKRESGRFSFQGGFEKCIESGAKFEGNLGEILASDFIWIFLPPYKGVIPNPKMVFIFPILCILVIISQNV